MANGPEILNFIDQSVKREFDANRRVLAFDEYVHLLAEKPASQLRGSARYAADMMDHFGRTETPNGTRFKLFDRESDSEAPRVAGQEPVQLQIYRALRSFTRQGLNNKLVLLHGPNGSAKSSLIHSLMAGLESYSRAPEGAMYAMSWVFPHDKVTKGGLGIQSGMTSRSQLKSYAHLPEDEVSARLGCDLRDHPLMVIPASGRKEFLEKLLGAEKAGTLWDSMPHSLTRGELCHRCNEIAQALLVAAQGDYKKVLMHVQVERTFLSRRYRKGLVTIEPQMHVDAQYQQLTLSRSAANLPASLHGIGLFNLSGDLVDGNRGVVEFSDLLKRPIDTFKYLLTACETGSVNVGHCIAYLDSVLLGSTNEIQLDAFKEIPDFTSFKGRIELIRVPYLLNAREEAEIYAPMVRQVGDKHIAPHVDWTLATWAVLTRLKKPNSINYPPNLSSIVSNLTPLEKAKLYDAGEMPATLGPEDRKLLKANIRRLREEYANIPYYEGRTGASAREMKSIFLDAAQNPEFPCVSPLSVLRQMEDLVKRVTEYEFLKQDVKDGFHDAGEFINVVRGEYLNRVDREVRDSIGLYDSQQWEEFLKKYVQHIALVLKKEKIKNPITGKMEDPDYSLVAEFEKIVEAPGEGADRDTWRHNIISQVGVWSLDHPNQPVVYAQVFPDFWRKLEKHYFESQKALLTQMHNALLTYDPSGPAPTGSQASDPGTQLAQKTVANLKARSGYCDHCAKEVITFLMKQRY